MALLNVRVVLGGISPFADTAVNQNRIFAFGGRYPQNPGFGNIPYKVPRGQYRFNLNNPAIPGAISVSSYSRVYFDSTDFGSNPELAGQISQAIEQHYIIVETNAAPGVPLTRTNIMAYV